VIHLRQASILFLGGLFVSLLAPSCTTDEGDDDAADCTRGTKDCHCKSDDTCNAGLVCNGDRKCESGAAGQGGSSGAGGSAGAATSGGSAGRAGGGRAGSESFLRGGSAGNATAGTTGGMTQDAGAGGEPATGGTGGGTGGTANGGSGNATGQAGEGGAAGDAGSPGTGGTGGSTGGTGGTAGMSGGGGYAGGTSGCSSTTAITVSALVMNLTTSPDSVTYNATLAPNLDQSAADRIGLQLWTTYGGDPLTGGDTGTFTLGTNEDANYATCARCLLAQSDATSTRYYFATAGTLTYASDSDQITGFPHGTLRNVVLREVEIDTGTFESTLVENGKCLTLANGDLLVNVPSPPAWVCPPGYYNDVDCDCGCGLPDPACDTAATTSCDYCWCAGEGGDCDLGTAADPEDNGTCVQP